MIDECLKEADLKPKDVDAFATTTGPGSFTGVRTSIGTLKALSFSFQKPLIGIPTLLAMVHPYDHSGTIIPTLDARKDFIYIGKFQKKDDFWTELEQPSMIPTSELKNHALSGSQIVAKDSNFTHIHGKTLCEIAVHKFKNNEFVDTLTVEPLYIQKTAAEGYV